MRNTQSMKEVAWATSCGLREEGLRAEATLVNDHTGLNKQPNATILMLLIRLSFSSNSLFFPFGLEIMLLRMGL